MPSHLNVPSSPATGGEAYWRRVLLLSLPLALLAFGLSTLLLSRSGQAEMPYNRIAYPLMEVSLVLAEVTLLVSRRSVNAVAYATIVGTCVFFLSKLVYLLFVAPPEVNVLKQLTDSFFWLPALYMLAAFVPELRNVQRIYVAFMLLMLGIVILAALRWYLAGDFDDVNVLNTLNALQQLILANTGFLGVTRATVSLLNARTRAMEALVLTDPLTGLYNRRFLYDRLPVALKKARDEGRALALIFFDLDGFKQVNDTFGHAAGDALLCRVARQLRAGTRAGELAVRVSGDEFVLLSPVASPVGAHERAAQMWNDLTGTDVSGADSDQPWTGVRVTASVGVSVYPFDAQDADALLSHADAAMYRVKNSGKNGVQPFERRGVPRDPVAVTADGPRYTSRHD